MSDQTKQPPDPETFSTEPPEQRVNQAETEEEYQERMRSEAEQGEAAAKSDKGTPFTPPSQDDPGQGEGSDEKARREAEKAREEAQRRAEQGKADEK